MSNINNSNGRLTTERANQIVAEECAQLAGRVEIPVVRDDGVITDGTWSEPAARSEDALRAQCREWVSSWEA